MNRISKSLMYSLCRVHHEDTATFQDNFLLDKLHQYNQIFLHTDLNGYRDNNNNF